MGIGGIGIGPLLVILLIVVLLFGTKKLKGMGSDLGGAVKGFKKALNDDSEKDKQEDKTDSNALKKDQIESEEKSSGPN